MDSFYVGDTEVRIEVDGGVDVSMITSAEIYYRKPDWTVGHWTATLGTRTVVYYDVTSPTDLDQAGLWTIWAVLTYPDTHTATTTPYTIRGYRPGFGGC